MQIINGKALAEQVKDGIAAEIYALGDKRPMLAIIMVGNRPDSATYVKIKEREAKKVGIDTSLYLLETNTTNEEILNIINFLNNDPAVNGILLQLPLPGHLDTDRLVNAIRPDKDIDGFTVGNLNHLTETDKPNRLISPVYSAVLMCLASTGVDLDHASTIVIAKPGIFGENLVKLLKAENYHAKLTTPDDEQLITKTRNSQIIITAVGQAGFIRSEHIRDGAIVIDIGINHNFEGQIVGDVDKNETENVDWLTPVPGGIGPLTVAFALQNTLNCFHEQSKRPNG